MLLKHYNITFWSFSDVNLCPPIPGRVDYIHHISDLLNNSGITSNVSVLDIGVGATCIYPILGHVEYKWSFVGSDIDEDSLKSSQKIITKNGLENFISLRHQKEPSQILKGIIREEDKFTIAMCNPPFYKSAEEALESTARKLKGLKKDSNSVVRNFSGKHNELWYKGGEKAFLHNYLYESSLFKDQCKWFTTLVSKKELVESMQTSLVKLAATQIKIINMGQGNKLSRIVAWTFV